MSAPAPPGPTRANNLALLIFIGVVVVALVTTDILVLNANNPARALGKHYYLALGNSLSFGFQPDLNFTSGFVDDFFADLRPANATDLVNYACGGETSTTMIEGNCPFRYLPHSAYTGPQLDAALTFIKAHRAQISPITLEIGANDELRDWDPMTCTANSTVEADLATIDQNLTQTILPQLIAALTGPTGAVSGDLHLINYYNPFAKDCPNSQAFVTQLNNHLAADAGQFRIPVVDMYNAFGGDLHTTDHICDYTWICDPQFHDFHPTTTGYQIMAQAVERALGYTPASPLQNILPLSAAHPPTKLWDMVAISNKESYA